MRGVINPLALKRAYAAGVRALAAVCAALAVAACGPAKVDLGPQHPRLAASFTEQGASRAPTVSTNWIVLFGSAELTGLARQALEGNFDIDAATGRIAEADAQLRISGAALHPQLNASGGASRSRSPGTLRSENPPFQASYGQRFDMGVTASYALDFWGRNRSLAQAGKLSAAASRYDYDTVALTTLSALANGYFQMLVAQERVRLARQNIKLADQIFSAIRARVEAGTATALDVAQQESVLANLRASVPGLEQQYMQQRNLIAVLAGRTPQSMRVKGGQLRSIKLPRVRAGLPSQLLLRRPDIAAAEARLAAGGANIEAARAAFYPSISLTADVSLESIALKNLLRPEAIAASIAASALQPIFSGYRLTGELEASKARWNQLLAAYRKSIVDSLADVENALIAVRKSAEQEVLRARAVVAAQRAITITQERLREGTIDVVTLLNTQQTLFNAQDALTQARFARLQALVSLFQALGGGFDRQADGPVEAYGERIAQSPSGVAPPKPGAPIAGGAP